MSHRLMRWISRTDRFISFGRQLELYPPFFMMRIKVLEFSNSGRVIRVRLPLNAFSKNPGGTMFGGYQACLADPIPAFMCVRVFPNYWVATRHMEIDFRHAARADLELRFEVSPEKEEEIRQELVEKGRSTPTFKFAMHLPDGQIATEVTNTVALRPIGYVKPRSKKADAFDTMDA
eukprot:m.120377 g.120377  ORF g.120377 m.120377 type:complete len:176 (+) comp19577_c0_seq4:162-689(+)